MFLNKTHSIKNLTSVLCVVILSFHHVLPVSSRSRAAYILIIFVLVVESLMVWLWLVDYAHGTRRGLCNNRNTLARLVANPYLQARGVNADKLPTLQRTAHDEPELRGLVEVSFGTLYENS
jgi:hypothetical protein